MALLSYFTKHTADDNAERLKDAHVVTVQFPQRKERENRDYDSIRRFDPCGTNMVEEVKPKEWGCAQVLQEFGIIPILGETGGAEFTEVDLPIGKGEMEADAVSITCEDL
jgi:hypothetical protein